MCERETRETFAAKSREVLVSSMRTAAVLTTKTERQKKRWRILSHHFLSSHIHSLYFQSCSRFFVMFALFYIYVNMSLFCRGQARQVEQGRGVSVERRRRRRKQGEGEMIKRVKRGRQRKIAGRTKTCTPTPAALAAKGEDSCWATGRDVRRSRGVLLHQSPWGGRGGGEAFNGTHTIFIHPPRLL